MTNDGTTGDYSLAVTPLQTTYYRFVFEGTGTYAAVTSGTLTVKVKPVLGQADLPVVGQEVQDLQGEGHRDARRAQRAGRQDPGLSQAQRQVVQVQERLLHVALRHQLLGQASRSTSTGKFKFKATVAGSAKFVAVTSAYTRVLTVKK